MVPVTSNAIGLVDLFALLFKVSETSRLSQRPRPRTRLLEQITNF